MAGLTTTLNTAVTGLKATQTGMAVLADNIANAQTENYARREIEYASITLGGFGTGVEVKGVRRKIDNFVMEAIRDQSSILSKSKTLDEFHKKIQLLFGQPNTSGDLDATLKNYFSSLKTLSSTPDDPALRLNVVKKGDELAKRISNLARGLEELRYEADQSILNSVDNINALLTNIHNANNIVGRTSDSRHVNPSVLETRDVSLQKLSEELNISIFVKDNNKVIVSTTGGKLLIGDNRYVLDYTPQPSLDGFLNDSEFHNLTVSILRDNGERSNPLDLVSAGSSDEVATSLVSGNIKAYLEMRDSELPAIIEQLDNLATMINEQVNSVYNDGNGYPPAASYVGTTPLLATARRDFSGQVMIALVDDDGLPLQKADGTDFYPLTLDLGSLDSGYGAGQPTVQTIIDEINEYFYSSVVEDTVQLGNLYDIKLVASDDLSAMPNGQITFDFELINKSVQSSTFEVLGITVTDGGCTGLTTALPASYVIDPGERTRTGSSMTVDFAGGGGGPYTIQAQLQVTDEEGLISTATIEYVIDDTPASIAIRNTRYVASAIAAGGATITPAGTTQSFARASLVNANGFAASSTEEGYLKIEALVDGHHIAFAQLTSKEEGLAASGSTAAIAATNRNFGHFFGLNNFFIDSQDTDGSAINMAVREDLLSNPQLVSTASLTQTPSQGVNEFVGVTQASAALTLSGIPDIGDTITIDGQVFTYVAAAATNDQITIGGTLAATLANTTAKLNAINAYTSGTVDQATYTDDATDTIYITFSAAGSEGNNFIISFNFATISGAINDALPATANSGNLTGGIDDMVTVNQERYTYQIGISNNATIDLLFNISNSVYEFDAAGNLSASSNTISGYASTIISFTATNALFAENDHQREDTFQKGFLEKYQNVSGININEEVANTIVLQNMYAANARVVTAIVKMFDSLLDLV
jgi:flagellar hook-associated protein 1 FlgK